MIWSIRGAPIRKRHDLGDHLPPVQQPGAQLAFPWFVIRYHK
jgi:hypothetical protein